MGTYLMLGRYSHDAIKKISAKRTVEANKLVSQLGGEVKAGYAMLGKDDLLLIAEFPGNEQAIKASVGLSKLLGVAFTTAPAVSVDEFDKLVG